MMSSNPFNGTLVVDLYPEDEVTTAYNNAVMCSNNIHDRYSWQEILTVFRPVALHVDRCVSPIWYIIGITGNILAARIWLDKKIRVNNSSAIYLATLSISDLFFLLLHILQELKYAWGVNTLNVIVICESYFTLSLIAQYLSPILVLAFTCERWIAVCHPFAKEKFCTSKRAVKVVIILICICALLGSMQSYFWTYNSAANDCIIRSKALEHGAKSLFSVWTWITEMLVFLIVPVVILVFNILVIIEVHSLTKAEKRMMPSVSLSNATNNGKSSTKNNVHTSAATTVMLLSVSFYVIFTTLPATLVYAIFQRFPEGESCMSDDEIRQDSQWNSYLTYMTYRKFVEEICLSHYACNFFLYVITGPQFRKTLLRLCFFPWARRSSNSSKFNSETIRTSLRNNQYNTVPQGFVGEDYNRKQSIKPLELNHYVANP